MLEETKEVPKLADATYAHTLVIKSTHEHRFLILPGNLTIYGFDRLQSRIASFFHWFWWLVGNAVFRYAGPLNILIDSFTMQTLSIHYILNFLDLFGFPRPLNPHPRLKKNLLIHRRQGLHGPQKLCSAVRCCERLAWSRSTKIPDS